MQTKIFLGFRFTPELKAALETATSSFKQIPYQGREYVGLYLEGTPTLEEVRSATTHLSSSLQKECPEIRVDILPLVVFPQLFLG